MMRNHTRTIIDIIWKRQCLCRNTVTEDVSHELWLTVGIASYRKDFAKNTTKSVLEKLQQEELISWTRVGLTYGWRLTEKGIKQFNLGKHEHLRA